MIEKYKKVDIFSWKEKSLSHLDPSTSECENDIQQLIHLQAIDNWLPDAFNYVAKVTKSHNQTINIPARIVFPEEPYE